MGRADSHLVKESLKLVETKCVFGDIGYCWTQLAIVVHPPDGSAPRRMEGPAFSLLRKNADGRWVIYRDANMLAPQTV